MSPGNPHAHARRPATQHVALVSDASIDLPPALAAELGLTLAPLGYDLAGRHHLTGDQTAVEFFAALAAGATAHVEGVAADDIESALRAAAPLADDLICVSQSVGSSHTRVSAEVAVRRVQVEGKRVELISPGRSTAGLGALCIAAARAAKAGASTDEVFHLLEEGASACDTYAIPGSLDYLERTGELAILNSQSNVGPIDSGLPLFRVRGRVSAAAACVDAADAMEQLLQRVAATAAGRPLIVVVAAAPDSASALTTLARSRLNVSELHESSLGPTIGSVLGPGTIALGFCAIPSGER